MTKKIEKEQTGPDSQMQFPGMDTPSTYPNFSADVNTGRNV